MSAHLPNDGPALRILPWALIAALVLVFFSALVTPVNVVLIDRAIAWLSWLAPGVAVAAACLGLGSLVIRHAPGLLLAERCALAFGAGLGLLSIPVALLGFTGALTRWSALAVVGAGLLCGLPLWKQLAAGAARSGGRFRLCPIQAALWVPLALFALLLLGFALTPPLIFDVAEYHLGPWREYLSNGTATFTVQPHNFYARFPFPIESLYYLGLALAPYTDAAPKVLNALAVLACALLGGCLAWRHSRSAKAATLAALAICTLPVMLDVSLDALIDAPVALLVIGSVYLLLCPADDLPGANRLHPSLLLLGCAFASKYTVAQLYLLPWLVLAAPGLWGAVKAQPARLAGWVALGALPMLVWYGKNAALYHNPLEPFFCSVFRPGDAAAIAREKFYIESHFPQSPLTASYWITLFPRLSTLPLIFVVGCFGWAAGDRGTAAGRQAGRAALYMAIAYLLWNTVRESQDRFLLPVMLLLVGFGIAGIWQLPRRWQRGVGGVAIVLLALLNLAGYALKFRASGATSYLLENGTAPEHEEISVYDHPTPREAFLEKNLGDLGRVLTAVNRLETTSTVKTILLVYEARPYLFNQDTLYNTVWDKSLLLDVAQGCTTVEEVWQAIAARGITHVMVNRQELYRYIQQYARPAQLRRLGVSPGEDPGRAWFETSHPERLYPPFYLDERWEKVGPLVEAWLADADKHAVIREGRPSPAAGVQPLDVFVAAVPAGE